MNFWSIPWSFPPSLDLLRFQSFHRRRIFVSFDRLRTCNDKRSNFKRTNLAKSERPQGIHPNVLLRTYSKKGYSNRINFFPASMKEFNESPHKVLGPKSEISATEDNRKEKRYRQTRKIRGWARIWTWILLLPNRKNGYITKSEMFERKLGNNNHVKEELQKSMSLRYFCLNGYAKGFHRGYDH